jgi:S1-C subfamily serine protease
VAVVDAALPYRAGRAAHALLALGLWCCTIGAAVAQGAAASAADVVDRVKPSIVAVGTLQQTRQPQFRFAGTGFAVGDGTIVATNAHVVPRDLAAGQDPEQLVVVLPARQASERIVRRARMVASASDQDLALLRIDGPALPPLAFGDSTQVREGATYFFTGFPVGGALGLIPVTHQALIGAVTPIVLPAANASQLDARVVRQAQSGSFDIFQLDAVAYPGNSGSPLYDIATGEVIGVVNMTLARSTRESALPQPTGIAFAIPVGQLREMLAGLRP